MKHTMQRNKPTGPARGRSDSSQAPRAPRAQWGGTILGFIAGVVVGLAAALAVAVYVTKVPIPFMSGKTQNRTADHDAAESRKNKDWDPNSPLYGKNPARPQVPASAATGAVTPSATTSAPAAPPSVQPAGQVAAPAATPSPPPARSVGATDPLGDLAKARSAPAVTPATVATTSPGADPFEYFVQAGAFRTPEDAETQRARLAMMGLEARVTEREQAGRTVFRVRMGPYKSKEDAERTKERLDGTGAETALVRVQR